jgi:hypothetical protein
MDRAFSPCLLFADKTQAVGLGWYDPAPSVLRASPAYVSAYDGRSPFFSLTKTCPASPLFRISRRRRRSVRCGALRDRFRSAWPHQSRRKVVSSCVRPVLVVMAFAPRFGPGKGGWWQAQEEQGRRVTATYTTAGCSRRQYLLLVARRRPAQ